VDAVRALVAETAAEELDAAAAEALNPALRPGHTELAALDTTAIELDVHGFHRGYVRGLRARGGTVRSRARVTGADRVAVHPATSTPGGT
jgi:D-arginine dehydrogenase